MKITAIRACRLEIPPCEAASAGQTAARRPSWAVDAEVANPMSKFPRYKRHRSSWMPQWPGVWVQVVAEDGTWGVGSTGYGRPVAAIVEDHFAPLLVGEECTAIDRLWDMMFRASKPYGTAGLAACAISAVDLALWDLCGKLRNAPVWELIGGPARERILCYATGNDTDWQLELGFRAVKLACPYGPADGLHGLGENERLVARTRELVGDDVEIMLDCYMAFDVEYTVRLAERLRPYRLKWIEEYLIPEDLEGHAQVRARLPWMTLAGGEHFSTRLPFRQVIEQRSLDILQPDIHWVGGLTECVRICQMADAAGLTVILHGGGGDPFGQHLTGAMPNTPWAEYGVWSAPGVPLAEARWCSGASVPQEGWLRPNDGPGFGLEIQPEWLRPFF
jgi:L-rhamnonate dehydratase